jgi:hypothetical protein
MRPAPPPGGDQPALNRERHEARAGRLERLALERQRELAALKASAATRTAAPS